jgi:uncharacterized protein (DUF1697 family)
MAYIALLRGINVGGRNQIAMSDLRSLLTTSGFSNAQSLLQSGNLVFEGGRKTCAELEHLLESETAKQLIVRTDYLVRTSSEWAQIVAGNPFRDNAKNDPSHLIVMFLKKAPAADDVADLQAAIKGPEIVNVAGRHAYIVYPAGIGSSKLTTTLIEAKLGSRGTGRNWNTVLKLLALVQA